MYERCCNWSETKTLEEMCLLTTIVFENNGISKIKAISSPLFFMMISGVLEIYVFTQDEKLSQKYLFVSSPKKYTMTGKKLLKITAHSSKGMHCKED